jgi:hypothetical protein
MQKPQDIVTVDYLHHSSLVVGVLCVILFQDDAFLDVFGAVELFGADNLENGGRISLKIKKGGHGGQKGEVFFGFESFFVRVCFLLFLHFYSGI